jgi:hypothetical protein
MISRSNASFRMRRSKYRSTEISVVNGVVRIAARERPSA